MGPEVLRWHSGRIHQELHVQRASSAGFWLNIYLFRFRFSASPQGVFECVTVTVGKRCIECEYWSLKFVITCWRYIRGNSDAKLEKFCDCSL